MLMRDSMQRWRAARFGLFALLTAGTLAACTSPMGVEPEAEQPAISGVYEIHEPPLALTGPGEVYLAEILFDPDEEGARTGTFVAQIGVQNGRKSTLTIVQDRYWMEDSRIMFAPGSFAAAEWDRSSDRFDTEFAIERGHDTPFPMTRKAVDSLGAEYAHSAGL